MSSEANGPYRAAHGAAIPAIVARYVPFVWFAPLQLTALAAIFVGAASTGRMQTNVVPWATLAVVMIAVAKFPVVTVRARIEGNHLIVDGYRWPGAQTTWSCVVHEATDFGLEVTEHAGHTFRRIALRTTDGKMWPLTQESHVAAMSPEVRIVDRLNAWLISSTSR